MMSGDPCEGTRVVIPRFDQFPVQFRFCDCDCELEQCVCVVASMHANVCTYRRALVCRTVQICNIHGVRVCWICDPCTCVIVFGEKERENG